MGRTKAWQPTDKLTKNMNTTAIQDEQMMIHVDNLKKGRVLSMFFQDESSWLLPKWLNEEKGLTTILFRDLTSRLTHGNTSQVFKAQPDNGVSLV